MDRKPLLRQPVACRTGRGRTPLTRLAHFLRTRLDASLADEVDRKLNELKHAISANRQIDLQCANLVARLPEEDRATAQALTADIHVYLTQRRNRFLRDARAGKLTLARMDRSFRRICLATHPPLDPDLPKAAAQAIVQAGTQIDLVKRMTNSLEEILAGIERRKRVSLTDAPCLRLGQWLRFLRWVPYDWAEELALTVLDRVPLDEPVERLRLWISVLRVFFCRPRVGADSLDVLEERLTQEFGWPPPMELRNLLRAVLVKGGTASARLVARRLRRNPPAPERRYLLETLTLIDKPAAARWLLAHPEGASGASGTESYIRLLVASGETSLPARRILECFWSGGDRRVRMQVIEAVSELHFTEMLPFLLDRFHEETDRLLRIRMVEASALMAGSKALKRLAGCVRKEPSVLRFYAMHLIHKRLLDSPMLLLQEDTFDLLQAIQRARADLYAAYRGLRLRKEGRRGIAEDSGHAALAEVLRDGRLLIPRITHNLFGPIDHEAFRGALLGEEDRNPDAGSAAAGDESAAEREAVLARSLLFLREMLLWQEWFVREVPFTLNEHCRDLLERIQRCDPLPFPDVTGEDGHRRRGLRTAFGIFCECTRQGLYLTDVLLKHLSGFEEALWSEIIRDDLTRRRVMIADGRLVYHPSDVLARHLQFTTFAHDYRYGKESLDQPSLFYLWLRFLGESTRIEAALAKGPWPALPPHPDVPRTIGPQLARVYKQHEREAQAVLELVARLHDRSRREGFEIRVIPNLTYGLFCVAPVVQRILKSGVHVSLAGISSQFCDDENVNRFSLQGESVFALKRYVFSNASNYGTLNGDRLLIVIDGTMEPIDRHDAAKIRLPKAYRGFVNHLVAVNYVRARYGYGMENAEREVAAALALPLRFVHNLVRTHNFRHLVDSLLLCFNPKALRAAHAAKGTGRTYYTFAQWNPDGMPAHSGPIGYERQELPCAALETLPPPALLFVSMNSLFNPAGVAAYFDNNPEVEHPRMYLGPHGVKMDIGWPEPHTGMVLRRGIALPRPAAAAR